MDTGTNGTTEPAAGLDAGWRRAPMAPLILALVSAWLKTNPTAQEMAGVVWGFADRLAARPEA